MTIKIAAFGALNDIIGKELSAEVSDTDQLRAWLLKEFPVLCNRKFAMAVNRKLISQNTPLTDNAEVALMPPYSGG